MKNTYTDKLNKPGHGRAALISVLLIFLVMLTMMQPAYAAAEKKTEPELAGVAEAVSSAGFDASYNAASAKGGRVWRVLPSGDSVKSTGGAPVSPAGDPEAAAPEIKAKGAALYSYSMGDIVFGKDENKKMEPYSTTKLLTCWLALKNLSPDETVKVSAKAAQAYENGTTIWLKEGEEISVRDLLYGAMLESGNDAAYALGEAVAGSEAAFADLMNKTVQDWGCKDTHFVNANGWKNKEHYSTARDMAVITAKCLESAELRDIAMTKTYTSSATNLSDAREMKNYFLHVTGNPEGLTGGKTGTWDDDDCAVVASFSEGGLTDVIVLLGDTEDGRPEDVRRLMSFSHDVTPGYIVPARGESVTTVRVRHGERTKTEVAADGYTYVYPAGNNLEEVRTEIKADKLEAPVKKGDEAGELLVYVDDELIEKHKLIATEDIETGWLPSYLYISNKATLNALKVIGVFIMLLVAVSLIGRTLHSKKKRKKRRAPAASGSNRDAHTTTRASSDLRNRKNTGTGKPSGTSRKDKKEARKRLREKYRGKH